MCARAYVGVIHLEELPFPLQACLLPGASLCLPAWKVRAPGCFGGFMEASLLRHGLGCPVYLDFISVEFLTSGK